MLALGQEVFCIPFYVILAMFADICVIIHILYMRKQKLRKANYFARALRAMNGTSFCFLNYNVIFLHNCDKGNSITTEVSIFSSWVKQTSEIWHINKGLIGTIEKINKIKSEFFEKISKIENILARLAKKKREKTQITKLGMKKGTLLLILQK